MNRKTAIFGCVSLAASILFFVSACQDSIGPQQPCRDIPDGGCPAYDNACMDPSCFTLYDCAPDGTWAVDLVCPAKEAGPDAAIETDASTDANDNVDAAQYLSIPGASGGPGCEDLQDPDCALGTAAVCGLDCCGCEDLFVCQSGGWSLWGECLNG
jgi:hypothetical protein